jgi:hypothetical protein
MVSPLENGSADRGEVLDDVSVSPTERDKFGVEHGAPRRVGERV